MSIEQHIEELRVELFACMARGERRQIEQELRDAKAAIHLHEGGRVENATPRFRPCRRGIPCFN